MQIQAAKFTLENTTPEGFEDFSSSQTTQVDIFYGKNAITSAMATFDTESFVFLKPELVIEAIKKILINQAAVVAALQGNIDTHTDLLCPSGQSVGCGVLRPEIAGIIFDQSRFRVELFISPDYQKIQNLEKSLYLANPPDNFSSVSAFRVDLLGGKNTQDFQQISVDSTIAYGKTHLHQQIVLDSTHGTDIQEFSLTHIGHDWLYRGGTLQTQGLNSSLVSNKKILGVTLASSLLMRTDLSIISGSPIILFLEERSRVDLILNQRVIRSSFYEAGNHQLDTSALPDGSHRIQIKITNSQGEKFETRYFTRSQALPPRNTPQYFAEIGYLIEENRLSPLPSISSSQLINIGSRLRLNNNLGTEFQYVKTNYSDDLAQVGLTHLTPRSGQNFNFIVANKKWVGNSYNLHFQLPKISANVRYRNLNDGFETASQDTDTFAIQPGEEINLSFSGKLFEGSLVGSFRQITNSENIKQDDYFLGYRKSILRRAGIQADLSSSINYRNGEVSYSASISISHNHKKIRNSINFGLARNAADKSQLVINASSAKKLAQAEKFNLTGRGFTSFNSNNLIAGMGLNGESSIGNISAEINTDLGENDFPVNYLLGIESTLLNVGKTLAIGSSARKKSGVIVSIDGNSNGVFDVIIDDRVLATVGQGKEATVLLSPYQSYKLSVRETGLGFFKFDEKPRSLTVLPGTVSKQRWDVYKQIVLIAQAQYSDGAPVRNARFTNLKEFASTDETGWFQVELAGEKILRLENEDNQSCEIVIPNISLQDEVVVLESLPCN